MDRGERMDRSPEQRRETDGRGCEKRGGRETGKRHRGLGTEEITEPGEERDSRPRKVETEMEEKDT